MLIFLATKFTEFNKAFALLSVKKERIKRHIDAAWQDAQSDVLACNEGFYNRVHGHSHPGHLSPQTSFTQKTRR